MVSSVARRCISLKADGVPHYKLKRVSGALKKYTWHAESCSCAGSEKQGAFSFGTWKQQSKFSHQQFAFINSTTSRAGVDVCGSRSPRAAVVPLGLLSSTLKALVGAQVFLP